VPLGAAGRRAIELARAGGALVSLDLSSVGPLLEHGRAAAVDLVRDAAPDVLFATLVEAEAIAGSSDVASLLDLAPLAVIKQGRAGATVFAAGPTLASRPGTPRAFDVATTPLPARDSTGAGDAFDAGFLASWLASEPSARNRPATLHRAVLAGHRAAARQLATEPRELALG
jgi:sugar/nucleoside kinase (ribokinase family)